MRKLISCLVFGNGKQCEDKAAFWNMTFSGLNALQSAVMLLLVTRLCGPEAGGVFTIAYTTSQLMYTVGSYSFRNFHATDTNRVYSYGAYSRARTVTCCAMAIAGTLYCLLRQYDPAKTGMVLAACAYRLIEAVEDLDHGELQRKGYLDVAGREGTLRLLLCDGTFLLLLLGTRSSLAAMLGAATMALAVTVLAHRVYGLLLEEDSLPVGRRKVRQLLLDCFPLFAAGCLAMYNANAAKYAIDARLGDRAQTYYSVIFMPVFTINLLSGMVFRPQLKRMSELWNGGDWAEFRRVVLRQVAVIAALAAGITLFGVSVGLRLLGLLYGLELSGYTVHFTILLAGGGLSALYSYMECCLTVMRRQRVLLPLGCVVAAAALLTADVLVTRAGLTGACWVYLGIMLIEALGAAGFTAVFYRQGKRERETMG